MPSSFFVLRARRIDHHEDMVEMDPFVSRCVFVPESHCAWAAKAEGNNVPAVVLAFRVYLSRAKLDCWKEKARETLIFRRQRGHTSITALPDLISCCKERLRQEYEEVTSIDDLQCTLLFSILLRSLKGTASYKMTQNLLRVTRPCSPCDLPSNLGRSSDTAGLPLGLQKAQGIVKLLNRTHVRAQEQLVPRGDLRGFLARLHSIVLLKDILHGTGHFGRCRARPAS